MDDRPIPLAGKVSGRTFRFERGDPRLTIHEHRIERRDPAMKRDHPGFTVGDHAAQDGFKR